MGFMLDVIFKQIAICVGTLQHFCSNLLKAHPSSNKIVITLHPCSSHLPQSKEVLKCWQSETLRGYTALLQHNRKSAQSPEWNVSICLQQASIKTSMASAVSNAVGDLQSFNSYFSTQERQDSPAGQQMSWISNALWSPWTQAANPKHSTCFWQSDPSSRAPWGSWLQRITLPEEAPRSTWA